MKTVTFAEKLEGPAINKAVIPKSPQPNTKNPKRTPLYSKTQNVSLNKPENNKNVKPKVATSKPPSVQDKTKPIVSNKQPLAKAVESSEKTKLLIENEKEPSNEENSDIKDVVNKMEAETKVKEPVGIRPGFNSRKLWQKIAKVIKLSKSMSSGVSLLSMAKGRPKGQMIRRKSLKSMVHLTKAAGVFGGMMRQKRSEVPRGGGRRVKGAHDTLHRS